MAQVTLPTLTWNMTPRLQISGSGSPSHQQMLQGIEKSFSLASYWEVYTPTTLTGSTYFLEVGPKSTSAIYNKYRILICGGKPSGSSGNGPIRSANESTAQYSNTEGIWVSFLAGSGSLTHPCPNGPGFDEAYGPNLRWSGWWQMHYANPSTGNKGEAVWLIESDEIVNIIVDNMKVSTKNLCTFGSLIYPFSDAVAESDGRIYGMYTGASSGLGTNLHQGGGNQNFWFTTNVNASPSAKLGGFRPSIDGNSGSFDLWYSSEGHTLFTSLPLIMFAITPTGELVYEPHFIYRAYLPPYYPLGQARQMYATQRMLDRTEIVSSSAGDSAGYIFNPAPGTVAADNIFFGNK